jgi:hypothetical protein
MKNIIVYDNTCKPNEIIREVIGEKGFGDVVVKRKSLSIFYQDSINKMLKDTSAYTINTAYDIELLFNIIKKMDELEDVKILHCMLDHIISDEDKVGLTYKKLPYILENIKIVSDKKIAALMFENISSYVAFLKEAISQQSISKATEDMKIGALKIEGLNYIGEISNFIQCITGNFDARYFNSLQGTEYRLRKSSTNKKKIKSEYTFYHLLPEKMQTWFVMPFDYREDGQTTSYAMERLHMTDIAIKWVHGSIGKDEFSQLMDMYFYFFSEREEKAISKEEYLKCSDSLYIEKVSDRIRDLKALPEYQKISVLLSTNGNRKTIDDIYAWYLELKEKVEKRNNYPCRSVIGHGDPCFANALYNRSTRILKFIDPKGALCEEELWTNPYYDIAKLSHSVCGLYDFFNNAMFDISIDNEFKFLLSIPFDNAEYKTIFRNKVEENGFDYWSVRLYEASLFLSMLPLHIDYPHKVFGFILNAMNILKEIEENV